MPWFRPAMAGKSERFGGLGSGYLPSLGSMTKLEGMPGALPLLWVFGSECGLEYGFQLDTR